MALQSQVRSFPLFGSLDLKSDVKYVTPGKLLAAQNARAPGVQGTTKRYGQSLLGTAVGIDAGRALGAFRSELLLFDGSSLWAYASGQETWTERVSGLVELSVIRSPVARSDGSAINIRSLRTANAEVYVWEDSLGGLYYAARDPESGSFLKPATLIDSGGSFGTVFAWRNFIWIGYLSATTELVVAKLSPFDIAAGLTTALTVPSSAGASVPDFAAGTNSLYIGYVLGGALTVSLINANLIEVSRQSGSATASPAVAIKLSADESYLMLAHTTSGAQLFVAGTDAAVTALSASQLVYTGPTATRLSLYPTAPGFFDLYASTYNTGGVPPAIRVFPIVASGTPSPGAQSRFRRGLLLCGDVVAMDGVTYTLGISDGTQTASYYLLRASDLQILQRFSATIAGAGTDNSQVGTFSRVDSQLFIALSEQFALRADAGGTVYGATGVSAAYIEQPEASQVQIATFGTTALISASNAYSYDGSYVVESGFWEFPQNLVVSAVGSGGSIDAGLHLYQVTYEWTDSAGNIHYSAPSYPYAVTTVANDSVTLTLPYLPLTLRTGDNRDATINVYRTLHDTQGPYYWVKSVSNSPAFTDGTASTVTTTDTASDATIAVQRQLYAPADFSGEIDNDAPPPFRCVVATKTRMFGIPQDDPYTLWYSKPLNSNRPVEWSAAQVKRIEVDGGLPTALGAIDTQVIVFKQSRIYGLPGQGPAANGLPANAFGELELISTTVGCTSQPSVLNTHEGCFFKSQTGMVALNRAFSIDFSFGVEVQPLVSALTITGAVSVPAQNQFRWSSSEGTCVVYDYLLKRWSTYANYAAVGFAPFRDTSARLRSDGTVAYEDTSLFTDFGSNVALTLETPWFKTADLAQGYAAVWYASLLGTFVDAHNLVIEVAYDYVDVPTQIAAWNPNTVNSLYGSDSPYGATVYYGSNVQLYTAQYQVRLALQRQVCEAIKFKIYDTGGSGQSCTLNEIALQFGVIGGINRVPMTTQQV